MKTKFHMLAIVGIAVLLGGCSTTPYMTMADVTDKALTKIAFPAPTPKMVLLRSKYIAATVGLYGAWAVKEHSTGEHIESDADSILRRLDDIEETLDDKWKANEAQNMIEYRIYVADALQLVKAATNPARRRYKEAILSAITSSNPIGAAKTAMTALKNLFEIKSYKGAIVSDARKHAAEILQRPPPSGSSETWKSFKEDYCEKTKDAATMCDGVPCWFVSPKQPPHWWQPLPRYLRDEMCKAGTAKIRAVDKVWIETAKTGRLGNINVTDDDWKRVDPLFQRACKKLAGLADKQNPCDKFK